jgi:hypothetical protein
MIGGVIPLICHDRLMTVCFLGQTAVWIGLVEANVSEKRAVSIFRAEMKTETLAYTSQFTRRSKPKEHNQNCHRHENIKSHVLFVLHCRDAPFLGFTSSSFEGRAPAS